MPDNPAAKSALALFLSVLAAYLYLQVPALRYYSLQVFAMVTLLYIYLQRRRGFALRLVNLLLLNFAFLLVVGASGGLASPFFALTFIELFFIALASSEKVAILTALEILVFHLVLSMTTDHGVSLSTAELSNLLALPVVMVFYIFAKKQYEKAYRSSLMVDAEVKELMRAQSDDEAVAVFVNALLNHRLPMLEFLLSNPAQNAQALDSEIKILKQDLNVLTRQIARKSDKANVE